MQPIIPLNTINTMNSRLRPSMLPQCSSCVRNYIEAGLSAWRPLIQQQTRAASKRARNQADTIPVQLLKDLDRFGKKGAFVPVSAGMMRNTWFPKSVARYPNVDERKAIKSGSIEVERDYDFDTTVGQALAAQKEATRTAAAGSLEAAWRQYMGDAPSRAASTRTVAKPQAIEIKPVDPERAIGLLDVLLPTNLEFARNPVARPQSENKSRLPESVQALFKASMPEGPVTIYGSVSTSDVAGYIKEHIAYNDEAAQIQINESNVKFVGLAASEDASRVKHLGEFEVEISMKGTDVTLRKRILVVKPRDGVSQTEQPTIDVSTDRPVSSGETLEHR